MATLAKKQIVQTGLNPGAYAAAAGGGDKVAPGPTTFAHYKNASVGDITITVDRVVPSNYGKDDNLVVVVPAGEERVIGPIDSTFASNTDGLAAITYSGVTTLTVVAFYI